MKIEKDEFNTLKPNWEWNVFHDVHSMDKHFAHHLAGLIEKKNRTNDKLAIVLPTGPVDFLPFVKEINTRRISMKNLFVFMMDEYCKDSTHLIDEDHPISFRKHIWNILYYSVDENLRMDSKHLYFPDPGNLEAYTRKIEEVGGIEITFAGFGINGHLAFNDPPEETEGIDEEQVYNSTTRVVKLSRDTIIQNTLAGTRGLIELVPPLAVTIGLKEILSSKEVHLYLPRRWHSGIMRRCLFGDITPKVPGSYLQKHPKVKIHMPAYVADVPIVSVQLDI
jgi:glucosamine-6-phosphate deaminase